MCLFKRKKQVNYKVNYYEKQETPPKALINEEAIAVVWSEDKKNFGEIFCENGAYKYVCWQLCYDEYFTGYYWSPIYSKFASFFDTLEKAKQAVEDTLQGYPPKT